MSSPTYPWPRGRKIWVTLASLFIALTLTTFGAPRALADPSSSPSPSPSGIPPTATAFIGCDMTSESQPLVVQPKFKAGSVPASFAFQLYELDDYDNKVVSYTSETFQLAGDEEKALEPISYADHWNYVGRRLGIMIYADGDVTHPLFDKGFVPVDCAPLNQFFKVECTDADTITMFTGKDAPDVNTQWDGGERPMLEQETYEITPAPKFITVTANMQPTNKTTLEIKACDGPRVEVLGTHKVTTSTVSVPVRVTNLSNTSQSFILTVENTTGAQLFEAPTGRIVSGKYQTITVKLPAGSYIAHARTLDDEVTSNDFAFTVGKYAAPKFTVTSKKYGHIKVCVSYPSYKLMWEDGNSKGTSFGKNHWTKTKKPGCTTLNTPNVKAHKTNWVRVTVSVSGPNVVEKIKIKR